MRNIVRRPHKKTSFLLASLVLTFGIVLAGLANVTFSSSVSADAQSDCTSKGDTWVPSGPGNLGAPYCFGKTTCEAAGNLWNVGQRTCVSGTSKAIYDTESMCASYGGKWTSKGYNGSAMTFECVGAPGRIVDTFTPEQEVSSLSYYTALADCINQRMLPTIQLSAADNGVANPDKWWDNSVRIDIGELYLQNNTYPGGDLSCAQIVTVALPLWGYGSDYKKFLNRIGYTFDTTTLKWTGESDGTKRVNKYIAEMGKQTYYTISGIPALSQAALYVEAVEFFVDTQSGDGCYAQDLGIYPGLNGVSAYKGWVDKEYVVYNDDVAAKNDAIKAALNNNNTYIRYTQATIVGQDRAAKPHGLVYNYSSQQSGPAFQANLFHTNYDYKDRYVGCDQLAKNISTYAGQYVLWLAAHPDSSVLDPGNTCAAGSSDPACNIPSSTSCAIDGVGWIVCGLMRALASFNDAMYGAVEGILLTQPLETNAGGKQTPQYIVWQTIRNIANVALVIVFLIIIFSQATSIGISSYGIKKMLPRLIIAAIAINISYFAMQLAVDVANLLGVGLNNFLDGIADSAFNAAQVSFENVVGDILAGTVVAATTITILSFTSLTATALGLLALPFLAVAALSVIAAFITLFLRNSLIILLVIISPLAFAAYLLPNTADLFTKWRKLLTSMLLLFPTAALLFAGAKIAGYTIIGTGNGTLETFFGYIVMAMPLFMLPWLARQGGGILKTVGDRLQGFAKQAKKPLQDVLKPAVDRERNARDVGRAGFFGRRRQLDADGYALNRDGTRRRQTGRQWIVNQRKDVEQTAKNDADRKERNWEQRAIDNPNGRTGAVITDKEQLHLRANSQAEALKVHEAHRIADPASMDKLYTNRIADAKSEMKPLQEIERRDQSLRIQRNEASTLGGGNLGDLSKAGYTAEKRADAAEKIVGIRNRQNNGAADAAIQSIKLSEAQDKRIDAGQQAVYDTNKATIGTDEQIAEQGTVFSVNDSARANAQSKAQVDQAADADAGQMANRDAQKAAEKTSEEITEKQRSEQEARLAPGGDLAGTQANIEGYKADTEVSTSAQQAEVNRRKKLGGDLQQQGFDAETNKRVAAEHAASLQSIVDRGGTQSNARELNFLGTQNRARLQQTSRAKFRREQVDGIAEGEEKNRQQERLGEGGDLQDLGDRKFEVDKEGERISEQHGAEDAARLSPQGDLADVQADIETAKAQKDLQTSAQSDELERRKGEGGDLQPLMDEKAAYDSTAAGSRARAKARVDAAKTTDGIVEDMDELTRARLQYGSSEEAAGSRNSAIANTVEKLGRSKVIVDNPNGILAQDMAGTRYGLSSTTNIETASAAKDLRADRQSDVAATSELMERDGFSPDDLMAVLGVARDGKTVTPVVRGAPPGAEITEIQKEAAIRKIAEGGDKGAIVGLGRYIGEVSRQADQAEAVIEDIERSGGTPTPEQVQTAKQARQDARDLQIAATAAAGSSPFITGTNRSQMAAGRLPYTGEELVINTLGGAKVSTPTVAGMDIDYLKEMDRVVGMPPEQVNETIQSVAQINAQEYLRGEDFTPQGTETQADADARKAAAYQRAYDDSVQMQRKSISEVTKALDQALDDPTYNNLEPRVKKRMVMIKRKLDKLREASIIPPVAGDENGPYVRSKYDSPGRKAVDPATGNYAPIDGDRRDAAILEEPDGDDTTGPAAPTGP